MFGWRVSARKARSRERVLSEFAGGAPVAKRREHKMSGLDRLEPKGDGGDRLGASDPITQEGWPDCDGGDTENTHSSQCPPPFCLLRAGSEFLR